MIRNKTKESVLAESYKLCKSVFSKARGLMFSKQKSLVFVFKKERVVSLHMLFVFYKIDVLFLDKNKKVVEIKEGLKPFGFYFPKNPCCYVLELKKGTIKKSKTSVGDSIEFS